MADYPAAVGVGLLGLVLPLPTNKQFMSPRKPHMPHLFPAKVSYVKVHAQNSDKTNLTSTIEKLQTSFNWNPTVDPFQGKLIEDGHVFRQNFPIRSYEMDSECKATIRTITNILQETANNHNKAQGLQADGSGSSPEMIKRNLIWVFYKTHIVVDSYPSWGDIVQVDKWFYVPGKNSCHSDWLFTDSKTGKTLIRATSMFVMMNKETRRPSKFINEVKEELKPYLRNCDPIIKQDGKKLMGYDEMVNKADIIRTGLTPEWDDLDVRMHVNNSKYIAWILQSVPRPILESYDLSSVTLEFRKECGIDSVLQSLTTLVGNNGERPTSADGEEIEMQHLLRLETGPEVARGRTTWKPKLKKSRFLPTYSLKCDNKWSWQFK